MVAFDIQSQFAATKAKRHEGQSVTVGEMEEKLLLLCRNQVD